MTAENLIPSRKELKQCYEIYENFMTGGIQHSLIAPEKFHQCQVEELRTFPGYMQKTKSLKAWASVTLLADGDVTLSISDALVNQHSPQEISREVLGLLKKINDDVTLLNNCIQRFLHFVECLIRIPAFAFSSFTFLSATRKLPLEFLLTQNQTYGLSCVSLVLLLMGLFSKPVASITLKLFLKIRFLRQSMGSAIDGVRLD